LRIRQFVKPEAGGNLIVATATEASGNRGKWRFGVASAN